MKVFFTEALLAIKTNLAGLPSFCRLVIYELLEYCDYPSGTISISTLEEIAHNDFHVSPTPGRKKDLINGDILRNAFRTIKKAKSEHFKFTTKNQRIIIDMPFLRELYQSFYKEKLDVAAVVAQEAIAPITLTGIEESVGLESFYSEEDSAEVAAASSRALNDIKNKTNNKPTNTPPGFFADLKQPIRDDFYPDEATIDLALSQGFVKVTDQSEIKKFILYNQASATRWADYNPIFLKWLECDKEPNATVTKNNNNHVQTGRKRNERNTHQVSVSKATLEDVYRANSDACAPGENLREPSNPIIEAEYRLVVDSTIPDLRPAFHNETWSSG